MDQIFSFVGWAFLPSYATSILQNIYYKLTIPVGRVPPQPGTPIYAKHHRRIRILVLTLYLLYTLLQSLYDTKLAGDFFTILSVTPSSTDREIKSRFRRLAAKYHPDKLRALDNDGSPTTTDSTAQDTQFLLLKTAQDTLLNPALRFAYTRFGPSITQLQSPITPTIRNYVLGGIQHQLLPSYITNITGLVVMNYLFLPKWGSYWRYLAVSSIVVVQLYFLTHSDGELSSFLPSPSPSPSSSPSSSSVSWWYNYIPHPSTIYQNLRSMTKLSQILPPHLLPYQILTILHKLSVSVNIFISQLAPPRQQSPFQNGGSGAGGDDGAIVTVLSRVNQGVAHLQHVVARTDAESTSLLHLQMAPFKGNRGQVERLREGMVTGMVTGMVRMHPEVKDAVKRVVERRKMVNSNGPGTTTVGNDDS